MSDKRSDHARVPPLLAASLIAVIGIGAIVALGLILPRPDRVPNIGLLFLAVVLANAMRYGTAAGLVTALLAFFAYNFFHTEPYYTLRVTRWDDVLALAVFLVVAGATGTLAGRVRDQMQTAKARMTALRTLYEFARRLGKAKVPDDLLHAVVLQAHRLSGRPAMILLPDCGKLATRYAWPPDEGLDAVSQDAAAWVMRDVEPAGAHTDRLPAARWHLRPMRSGGPNGTDGNAVGVFGVAGEGGPLSTDVLQTLDAMLDQAAVAVERIEFAGKVAQAEAQAETERFRAALLSSISHDLRTPLTSILGSVTALRYDAGQFDAAARAELLATIEEESERLDRYVENLLAITKVEAGAVQPKRDWVVVAEVVDTAVRRVAKRLGERRLIRQIPLELPLLRGDFVLLETVLVNLLDNAIKHAVKADVISIEARTEDDQIVLSVTDNGDGVPIDALPRLFDKFFRIQRQDRTVAGTGLGLSICKGLMEAMGGTIEARSPALGPSKGAADRGMRFTLRFPLEPQPAALETSEARA